MKTDLFDFDLTRWEIILISLVPACINIAIFLFSFLGLEKSRVTFSFSFFVLTTGLWQLAECFMRLSITYATASNWQQIAEIFIQFPIPFGILFVLHQRGWIKKKPVEWLIFMLFFEAILSIVFIQAQLDEYDVIKSEAFYWIANPRPTGITIFLAGWIALGALTMLLMLWIAYLNSAKGTFKRKQAFLFAAGLSAPVFLGITCEIFFPLVFNLNDFPITGPSLTIFSICALVAIRKYKMFEYTPKHHWRQIVEGMSDGIIIVDLNNRIKNVNQGFCRLTGYDLEELEGKCATDVFTLDEKDRRIAEEAFTKRKRNLSSEYEIAIKHKNGNTLTVLIKGSPYLDKKGKVIGAIGILTDVSHFKETKKILEHNEMRLKQAQEVAHVGSWELDFATGKAIWSEEACRIYGLSINERENQSFESWIQFIHPDDLQTVKEGVERAESTLQDHSFIHRIVRTDGAVRHIHSVSKFEFDEAGKPKGLFGVCHDVTESMEAAEKLRSSNKELETFIYKASHDIRGPLASIMGLVNVSKLEKEQADLKEYIGKIGVATDKLDHILGELVKSMQIREAQERADKIDFRELTKDVISRFTHFPKFEKINFISHFEVDGDFISNRGIIDTILQNLVENSIKYQGFNGEEPFVLITVKGNQSGVKISVEDNGSGIEEAMQSKVFDMYFRANLSASGSGLGLYLVKKGVDKLKGTIDLRSRAGKGTCVTVALSGTGSS